MDEKFRDPRTTASDAAGIKRMLALITLCSAALGCAVGKPQTSSEPIAASPAARQASTSKPEKTQQSTFKPVSHAEPATGELPKPVSDKPAPTLIAPVDSLSQEPETISPPELLPPIAKRGSEKDAAGKQGEYATLPIDLPSALQLAGANNIQNCPDRRACARGTGTLTRGTGTLAAVVECRRWIQPA